MFTDMAVASDLYKPTNYWQVYEDRLAPEIRRQGITRFRSSDLRETQRFGVSRIPTRFLPESRRFAKVMFAKVLARFWSDERNRDNRNEVFHQTFLASQNLLVKWLADIDPKRELETISDSGFGDPTDSFVPNDSKHLHSYTISFLRYFADYLWIRERIPFEDFTVMLELGTGYGGQTEVIKKLYPNLTYVVCDIPPQLYIAEQYLQSVFPGQVVGYEQTRQANSLTIGHDGKIHIIEPFQLEQIRFSQGLDLFWSVASFQEMEPAVVANYLKIIQRFATFWIYLVQNPIGKTEAREPGKPGVLEPVTRESYIEALKGYRLNEEAPAWYFNSTAARGFELVNDEFVRMLFERGPGEPWLTAADRPAEPASGGS